MSIVIQIKQLGVQSIHTINQIYTIWTVGMYVCECIHSAGKCVYSSEPQQYNNNVT